MTRIASRLRPDFVDGLVEQRARIRRKWMPVFVCMSLVIGVETACVAWQFGEIKSLQKRQLSDEDLARLRELKAAIDETFAVPSTFKAAAKEGSK